MTRAVRICVMVCLTLLIQKTARAQFAEGFASETTNEWSWLTGDGRATMALHSTGGHMRILVDATQDEHNIWWALVKREVQRYLDLSLLSKQGYELRVEARVRPSHAPRRINLHLNTQRTVDFHTHLMEYDLGDTGWHTISMTTRGFDAGPGDSVRVQLALMDWGIGRFHVDVDSIRVDVVRADSAGSDLGEPLPYHPPVPRVDAFSHHLEAAHRAVVDNARPNVNMQHWHAATAAGDVPVLTVGASLRIILRWDLDAYGGLAAARAAILELPVHSVYRDSIALGGLCQIRISEIAGGDPTWDARTVTYAGWTRGLADHEVVNTQMVIDVDVPSPTGGPLLATINRPVMQRLLDGRTLGLVVQPLGAVSATFLNTADAKPRLHFDTARER